jgi:N-acyl-D-amino-acid deacylase
MLEQARKRGVKVTCDQYPYHASSTGLSALAPGWAHDGGISCLTQRAKEPSVELLEAIGQEMDRRGGPQAVLVVDTHDRLPDIHGKTMDQIATAWQMDPPQAVARCLALCDSTVSCIYFSMSMEDVCRIMQDMNISVGSDGVAYEYAQAAGHGLHPRNFGTFPRFLQLIREKELMPWEKAVYKMTGLPASVLGLKDRGVIREGMVADLTVFDPQTVEDKSTFTESAVKPVGIYHVMVAGQLALKDAVQTDVRAGRVLLHTR